MPQTKTDPIAPHFFLLAERYHGPTTSIVECSVRSKDNKVISDEDHADPIKILWHKDVKSGVCQGQIKDYDEYRVTRWGLKWLPDLLPSQRRDLVTDALSPVRPVPATAVSPSLTPRNRAPPRHAQASLTAANCPPSASTHFSLEVPHAHP